MLITTLLACTTHFESNPDQRMKEVPSKQVLQVQDKDLWPPDRDDEAESANKILLKTLVQKNINKKHNIENISFPELDGKIRTQVLRHLATSAKWQVIVENQKIIARRRIIHNGEWTPFQPSDYDQDTHQVYWMTTMQLAPDGHPYQQELDPSLFKPVSSGPLNVSLDSDSQKPFSTIILKSGKTDLEVMDGSPYLSRVCTNIVLQNFKKEIEAVLSSKYGKEHGYDPALMPQNSILLGKAQLKLRASFQPGIYFAEGYINPGEPGYIYLKAYENIHEKPLSSIDNSAIIPGTREYIGWSLNPREQFFFGSNEFKIVRGGVDYKYPARIEVWFHSQNTSKTTTDRKLFQQVFMVNDWQR